MTAYRSNYHRDCIPELLCGYKVWVARAQWHGGGGLPQVWVHSDPMRPAVAYFCGRSLIEGATDADDIAHLEHLVRAELETIKPTKRLMAQWDRDAAAWAEAKAEPYA